MKRFAVVVWRWVALASRQCFHPHGETSIAGSTGETPVPPGRGASATRQRGYTIVELLMATTLTLILMAVVATIFGAVSRSVHESRATLEMSGRLRAAKKRLQLDLEGLTVTVAPPRRPEAGEGYLEIIEGPVGPVNPPETVAVNSQEVGNPGDTTVADFDDILMLTTRSRKGPFVGRYGAGTLESHEAEVAWFVRDGTLYRRVLLVAPQIDVSAVPRAGFYANYDISVRFDGSNLVGNTLGDLTKPENRYAHRPLHTYSGGPGIGFPYHPHFSWNWTASPPTASRTVWATLGLPTLCECSYVDTATPAQSWMAGGPLPILPLTAAGSFDAWVNPHPWNELDRTTGAHVRYYNPTNVPVTQRIAEDVILTNVIGFDVKVWDPGAPVMEHAAGTMLVPGDPGYVDAVRDYASRYPQPVNTPLPRPASYGAYVDLNSMCRIGPLYGSVPVPAVPYWRDNLKPADVPNPVFCGAGHPRSRLRGTEPFLPSQPPASTPPILSSVYDTWSFHYENDGIDQDQDGIVDEGTNGFDDDGNGIVDDIAERETSPPYPVPLRGIQVQIRTFEPDSRQVRTVTVVMDFVTK